MLNIHTPNRNTTQYTCTHTLNPQGQHPHIQHSQTFMHSLSIHDTDGPWVIFHFFACIAQQAESWTTWNTEVSRERFTIFNYKFLPLICQIRVWWDQEKRAGNFYKERHYWHSMLTFSIHVSLWHYLSICVSIFDYGKAGPEERPI